LISDVIIFASKMWSVFYAAIFLTMLLSVLTYFTF
jgi:hypothetical protein